MCEVFLFVIRGSQLANDLVLEGLNGSGGVEYRLITHHMGWFLMNNFW